MKLWNTWSHFSKNHSPILYADDENTTILLCEFICQEGWQWTTIISRRLAVDNNHIKKVGSGQQSYQEGWQWTTIISRRLVVDNNHIKKVGSGQQSYQEGWQWTTIISRRLAVDNNHIKKVGSGQQSYQGGRIAGYHIQWLTSFTLNAAIRSSTVSSVCSMFNISVIKSSISSTPLPGRKQSMRNVNWLFSS